MNFARGFLRIWIAASIIWSGVVLASIWSSFVNPYLPTKFFILRLDMTVAELSPALGVNAPNHRELSFPDNVIVFIPPEVAVANLDQWAPIFAKESSQNRSQEKLEVRFQLAFWTLVAMTALPLTALTMGLTVTWILKGFKRLYNYA